MENNKRVNTKALVTAALFAAICYGMTMISVPLPVVGYGNLGDCFVLLCGWMLGPVWGAAAAGLGSALADLTLGYGLYAPVTFVIKALMAVVVSFLGKWIMSGAQSIKRRLAAHLVAAVCGELLMICGYFAYETILYGAATAAGSLLGNTTQAVVAIVLSTCLILVICGNGVLKRLFPRL